MFGDSLEYQKRVQTPFTPPKATWSELHAAIPKELFKKSTTKALFYVCRDMICGIAVYRLGTLIDDFVPTLGLSSITSSMVKWTLWASYWFLQSVILTGWWCMAHDAGHGTLSSFAWVNHFIGYTLHTFLLVPYFSWRSTHHSHHRATNSLDRDVNYIPRDRAYYNLPSEGSAQVVDYHEVFEETPIYTLVRMLIMQLLGWQMYLLADTMGNPKYPVGTNHVYPSSPLFKQQERPAIVASNIGVSSMMVILWIYASRVGTANFFKLYFIPYVLVHHWIVMLTFLHHCDPSIPYYRGKSWSFVRGAVATVDRPLLGYLGRFFLHNISHDHVAHHLFSSIPFYNQPQVTEHIKGVLKEDYNHDSSNTFRALYRSFTQCCFIEDDGNIVFYKNRQGKAVRTLSKEGDIGRSEERDDQNKRE